MNAQEILAELAPLGSAGYKKVMLQHGVREPFFGVKIEDLKKIQKRIKTDYQLSLDLYATGNSDAMYLAGLIADDARMTREDLERWVDDAYCPMHSEYTVPWVATGNPLGRELALEWIESDRDTVAAAGWATLGSLVSVKPDAELDLGELERLLERVRDTLHDQPNRVRYVMNGFVIGVGCYVPALTAKAREVAAELGAVTVDMGGTCCKVPDALDYIAKVEARGTLGKKRKTVKC